MSPTSQFVNGVCDLEQSEAHQNRVGRPGDTWHLDEVFIRIKGKQYYLWRAVDQDRNILVQRIDAAWSPVKSEVILPVGRHACNQCRSIGARVPFDYRLCALADRRQRRFSIGLKHRSQHQKRILS